jgi:hypothetical protein
MPRLPAFFLAFGTYFVLMERLLPAQPRSIVFNDETTMNMPLKKKDDTRFSSLNNEIDYSMKTNGNRVKGSTGGMEKGRCKEENMVLQSHDDLLLATEAFENMNSQPALDCSEDGVSCTADYSINTFANVDFSQTCQELGGRSIQKAVTYKCNSGTRTTSLDEITVTILRRDCMAMQCSENGFCRNFELPNESDPTFGSIVLDEDVFLDSFEAEYVCIPRECAFTEVDNDSPIEVVIRADR